MTIKLGNQLLAKVQEEMAANISAIKKQLVEWLERPESGGINITIEKFREIGGGLALLRQEEVSQLVNVLVEGLDYLSGEVGAGHLSEDDLRFHEIGAEVAAGLLIVEDYISHLGAVRPLEREAVGAAHKTLKDLLENKGASEESLGQRPTITKETYRALTNQINELFETNKHQIDQQVRSPEANFNINNLKNSNGDLIRVFELLNLSSPRLLLSKVNEMIKPNLSESQWVEIAEAMLLVEKSLLQLEDDGGRSSNLDEARQEQIKHSRQLEVYGVIRATSEMALDYFAGVRKDVVSQEKLSKSQHWEKSAYMLAQYAPIFQLVGLTELAEQLNKLGLCYSQLSLQDDAAAAQVYAPVVDSLVALEQILNDLKEAAELQDDKALAFLGRAIGDFTAQMAPGSDAQNVYRSFAQRAMHSDSIHEEESALDTGEFLSDLDSLEVPEMETELEDLSEEEAEDREVKPAVPDSFGEVLADFSNINFGLAASADTGNLKASNAAPVSLEMSLDALDSLDNNRQGGASPVGKTSVAQVEVEAPKAPVTATAANPVEEPAEKGTETKGLFSSLKGALSNLVGSDGREESAASNATEEVIEQQSSGEPASEETAADAQPELSLDSLALESLGENREESPAVGSMASPATETDGEPALEFSLEDDSSTAAGDSLAGDSLAVTGAEAKAEPVEPATTATTALDFSLADDLAPITEAVAAPTAAPVAESPAHEPGAAQPSAVEPGLDFSLAEESTAPRAVPAADSGAPLSSSAAAESATGAAPIVKYFAAKSMTDVEAMPVPAAKADFSAPMDGEVVDEEIRGFFMEEFNEIIDTLNRIYPQWREKPDDRELTTDVRRAFHTLKGSGRTVGYQYLGEFAWQNERLLNGVNEGLFANNSVIQDTIGDSIDLLNVLHGQENFGEPKGALLAQAYSAERLRDSLAENPDATAAQLQGFAQQFRLGAGQSETAAGGTATNVNVAHVPHTGAVADNLSVSFGEAGQLASAVPVQLPDVSETLGNALSADNFRKIVEAIKVAEDAAYDVNNPAFNTLSAVISSHWENRESLKNEQVRDEIAHKLTQALDNYPELPVLQALLNRVAQQYMDFGRDEGLSIAEDSRFASLALADEAAEMAPEPAPAEASSNVENYGGLDFSLVDEEEQPAAQLEVAAAENANTSAASDGLDFSLADDEPVAQEVIKEEPAAQKTAPAGGGFDFTNLSLVEEDSPATEAAPGPLEPMVTAPASEPQLKPEVSLDDFFLEGATASAGGTAASGSAAGGGNFSAAQLEQLGEQLHGQLAGRMEELAREQLANHLAAADLHPAPAAGLDENTFNRMLGTLKTLLAGGEVNETVENALAATIGRRWGQHEALQREDSRQHLADRLSAALGNIEAERLADILNRAVGQKTDPGTAINIQTGASPVGKNTEETAASGARTIEVSSLERPIVVPEGFAAPTYNRIANTLRGTLDSGTFDENMALALAKVIQKQIEPADREKLAALEGALADQFTQEGLESEGMLTDVFQHLARLMGVAAGQQSGTAGAAQSFNGRFIDEVNGPMLASGDEVHSSAPARGTGGFIDELNTPLKFVDGSGDEAYGSAPASGTDGFIDELDTPVKALDSHGDEAIHSSAPASGTGGFIDELDTPVKALDSHGDEAYGSAPTRGTGGFIDELNTPVKSLDGSGDELEISGFPEEDEQAPSFSLGDSGDFLLDSFGLATAPPAESAGAVEQMVNSGNDGADFDLATPQDREPTVAADKTAADIEPAASTDTDHLEQTEVKESVNFTQDAAAESAADTTPAPFGWAGGAAAPQFELDLDFSQNGQREKYGLKASSMEAERQRNEELLSTSSYEAPSSSLSNLASLGIDISQINEDASGFKKKPDPYETLANFSFSPVASESEGDDFQTVKVRVSDDENAAELVKPTAEVSAPAAGERTEGEAGTEEVAGDNFHMDFTGDAAIVQEAPADSTSSEEKAAAETAAGLDLNFIDGGQVDVAKDGEEATPMLIPVADEDLSADEVAKGQEQLAELEKKNVQPIIAPLSSLSASSLPSQVAQGNWATDKGGPVITAANAKNRLDQELSALQNSTVVRNVVIDRGSHFLRAVDRFENLSQMVESNQNGELVDDLLDSIYDIEDSLDSSETPGWVWNVLGTIEELLNSYKESGEQLSYNMANSLRQSANIIENYQESSEQEAIDNINELLASHRAKQQGSGQKKEVPKTPEGMPAMASSHLLGQNVPDPNWGTLLAQTFMDEAQMLFGRSQNKSEQWEIDREQTRHLDSIRRDMHTIKGTARMAGYLAIGDLAHSVESLIDSVVTGYIPSSPKVGKTLTNALWNGTEMLESIREGYLPQPNPQVMNNISACLNMPLPYTGFGVNPSLFDEGEFREIEGATPTDNPYETFKASRGEGEEVGQVNSETDVATYDEAVPSEVGPNEISSSEVVSDGVASNGVSPNEVIPSEAGENAVGLSEVNATASGPQEISAGAVGSDEVSPGEISLPLEYVSPAAKGGDWNSEHHSGGKGAHGADQHGQGYGQNLHTGGVLPSMDNSDGLGLSNSDQTAAVNTEAATSTTAALAAEDDPAAPEAQPLVEEAQTATEPPAQSEELATPPEESRAVASAVGEDGAEVALKVRYLSEDENIDPDILDIFKDEAQELLATSSKLLGGPLDSKDKIHELQRAMHTLKGSSRMAGLTAIGDVSHWMESIVEQMPDMEAEQAAKAHELLNVALETQYSMFDSVQRNEFPQEAPELLSSLEHFAQTGELRLPSISEKQSVPTVEPAKEADTAIGNGNLHTGEAPVRMDNLATADGVGELNEAKEVGATDNAPFSTQTAADGSPQEAFAELSEKARRSRPVAADTPANSAEEQKFTDQRAQIQADKDRKAREKAEAERRQKALKKENSGDLSRFVRVDADLLDEMIAMLGESAIMRSRMENVTAASEYNLNELTRLATRIADQVRRFDNETEAQMRSRRDSISVDDEHFDPLEMDRFSELQQLSRQLAEAIDDLKNIQETLTQDNTILRNLTIQQGDVQRDLQDRLLTTQLMRFDVHEPRLRRLIKQTASSVGKEVNFILEGGEVELERRLLEDLLPSLEHMIRNSIAHGIEMPERRRRAGKPEAGTIKVAVSLRTSEISVRVIDDGAGIDYDKIRAKAAAKGWLDPERANDESYLNSLMMRSGFSTAENLSQLSGRGVGMDVVHEMLKQRRGQIHAYSIKNKGTEFDITMPFSMSIAEVLLVEIAGQTFAAPMSSITAVTQIEREELLRSAAGETIFHRYQDVDYRLFILGQYFKPDQYVYESEELRAPVLLIHTGLEAVAFHVDKILNRMEIIVKNVNRQVLNIPGISGATILGDGRVAPVLEVLDLARRINDLKVTAPTTPAEAAEEVEVSRNVLVVDDSVTMRKVSTRLLERNHYTVMTAKDGLDAIEVLKSYSPDIILLDIEMPNMDGFEFASHVRQLEDPRLRNVPIVMITSRTGDKHRERADTIGVQGYLGKPYREEVLLETLSNLLEKK